jgi:formate dehydrogenase subunit gamma
MTSMPGSGVRMGTRPRRERIDRFDVTERLAHWLLAGAFFVMLGSGLALYLPSLSSIVARPTAKAWHLWSAAVLGIGLVALIAFGNRRSLGRTALDLERLDRDDAEWIAGAPSRFVSGGPAPPQGRFNAGQKLNAAITLGLMIVMAVTGVLLWYGEQDTAYRYAGTVYVHDWGAWLLIVLVAGHMYLAVLHPATRHALRGMTLGDVDREWALKHHAKWVASVNRPASMPPRGADEDDRPSPDASVPESRRRATPGAR